MAETRGIEETKDILDFMFSFVEAVGKAKSDGEMSWSDARYFIDPVKKLFEAVDDIEEVLPEIEDLSEEEAQDRGSGDGGSTEGGDLCPMLPPVSTEASPSSSHSRLSA